MVQAEAARLAELAQGDEKPAWVEVDMTGKPIEEVIEYQVRGQVEELTGIGHVESCVDGCARALVVMGCRWVGSVPSWRTRGSRAPR